jgi:hypothetical protein
MTWDGVAILPQSSNKYALTPAVRGAIEQNAAAAAGGAGKQGK